MTESQCQIAWRPLVQSRGPGQPNVVDILNRQVARVGAVDRKGAESSPHGGLTQVCALELRASFRLVF